MVSLDDNLDHFNNVFMAGVFYFSQIAEGCNFAAEEIAGDLVIDGGEVDALDGHLAVGLLGEEAQVDVAGAAFPQKFVVADRVGFVYFSYLRLHYLWVCNVITDLEYQLLYYRFPLLTRMKIIFFVFGVGRPELINFCCY